MANSAAARADSARIVSVLGVNFSAPPKYPNQYITALLLKPAKPTGIETQTFVNQSPETDKPTQLQDLRSGAENIQLLTP